MNFVPAPRVCAAEVGPRFLPRRLLAACSLLAALAGGAGLAAAQGIGAVRVDNRSSADLATVGTTSGGQPTLGYEFSSGASIRPPRPQGDASGFAGHMEWFGGYRLGPGLGPAAVKPAPRQVNLEYGVTCRVDDPQLIPGNSYMLTGYATSRINGSGQYAFNLQLAPVPEPVAWALLAAGLPLLLWRRRQARPAP